MIYLFFHHRVSSITGYTLSLCSSYESFWVIILGACCQVILSDTNAAIVLVTISNLG